MNYLAFIITFSLLFSYQMKAQESIILKLKTETINDLKLPVKVGKITTELPNSIIGCVLIPELEREFNLQFEGEIASNIENYISFLQTGKSFMDTVNLNITNLKIKEKIDEYGDEIGFLDLEIEFYKILNNKKPDPIIYKNTFEITDRNVTVFHEYNIRKGITEALNWLAVHKDFKKIYSANKTIEKKEKVFIKTNQLVDEFEYGQKTTFDFREVEVEIKKLGDLGLNNRIMGRNFINGLATSVAVAGLISGTWGLIQYDNALENDSDPGNAGNYILGGVGGLLTGYLIQQIGKKSYRTRIIKKYNEIQLNRPMGFSPNNPIKIGFAISLN